MAVRVLSCLILLALLSKLFPVAATAQDARGLRDSISRSPTWGYTVRWHSDEWTVSEGLRAEGTETLSLTDVTGNRVMFMASPRYDGNAIACLDDQLAALEAIPGARDIEVVHDETDARQMFRDARRAWVVVLVRLPIDRDVVDHVVYVDCLTLAPGGAVLVRTFIGAASTFNDSAGRLDVLAVVLPRSAYHLPNIASSFREDVASYPVPVASDSRFPYPPDLLADPAGVELGMMTVVDGNDRSRVVTIQNSGSLPLTVDPEQFTVVNGFRASWDDDTIELAPSRLAWEDIDGARRRILDPGAQATLLIEFPIALLQAEEHFSADPAIAALVEHGTLLIYRGSMLRDEAIVLDCVDGCAGGASRPKLRLSR